MSIENISVLLLVLSSLPGFFLYSQLFYKLPNFDNISLVPMQIDNQYILRNRELPDMRIHDPSSCYGSDRPEHMELISWSYNSIRVWHQRYYQFFFYVTIALFVLSKAISGYTEEVLLRSPKSNEDKVRWAIKRILVIVLVDNFFVKLFHCYRIIAYTTFDECLGFYKDSTFRLDFHYHEMYSTIKSKLLEFFHWGPWEARMAQISVTVLVVLIVVVIFLMYKRAGKEVILNLIYWIVLLYMIVWGGFGLVFNYVFVAIDEHFAAPIKLMNFFTLSRVALTFLRCGPGENKVKL